MFCTLLLLSNTRKTYAEDNSDKTAVPISFITINESGNSVTVKSDARTVEEVLSRLKIKYSEHDLIEPKISSVIDSDNFQINIRRARPIMISSGLNRKYFMTAKYDLEAIVEDAGFTLDDGDEVIRKPLANVLEAGLVESYEIVHNKLTEEIIQPVVSKNIETNTTNPNSINTSTSINTNISTNSNTGNSASNTNTNTNTNMTFTTRPDVATCKSWLRTAGVAEKDIEIALNIIMRESRCRYNARNTRSGAYGIPQSLPGNKMSKAGSDWETNPITQIRWMISYVNSRYHGWSGAWSFWRENKWY